MLDEKLKKSIGIDDELIDKIVDEIVTSIEVDKREKFYVDESVQKRNFAEMAKFKERIVALENRVEKYVNNFKLAAVEAERLVTEKTETLNEENQKRILHLQEQIEDLRDMVKKISKEINKLQRS